MNGAPPPPPDFPLVPATASPARPQAVPDPPVRAAFAFDAVEDAVAAFARGEFVVVMDDEGRENEGDLVAAASAMSTEKMAWMIKHTRCVFPPSHRPALQPLFSPSPVLADPAGSSASRCPATASPRSRSP